MDTPGIVFDAENGDIDKGTEWKNSDGSINVDILTIGGDGNNGNIQIEAKKRFL